MDWEDDEPETLTDWAIMLALVPVGLLLMVATLVVEVLEPLLPQAAGSQEGDA